MHAVEIDSATSPQRWAWFSIIVNIVLVALNLVVVTWSGSLAVGVELVHNGVDLVSAVAVLMGIKLATRKSRSFPYGLYKLENIIAVAVAGLIFFTTYEIVRMALFGMDRQMVVNWWMFAVLGLAIVIPAVFSRLELRVGRATNSPALIADAKEYQVHVLTTGIALAALGGEYLGIPLDRVAALIIVVPVVKTGWDLFVEGMRVLLDASLERETLDKIRDLVLSEPMVVDVKSITGRNAGRFRFVEITAIVRGNNFEKADCAAHRIERRIHERISNIERALVHVDPNSPEAIRYIIPLADPKGTLANGFEDADFVALATMQPNGEQTEPIRILKCPRRDPQFDEGIALAEWLVGQNPDVVVLRGLPEKGPQYVFGDAAVTMKVVHAETLEQTIAEAAESQQGDRTHAAD